MQGVIYRNRDAKVVVTDPIFLIEDLDSVPFPGREHRLKSFQAVSVTVFF